MIRSSRLRAAILAALFAAILTTTAYAGVARCHRTVNGTKFNDLNANGKRDSGEPGLAGWRIWADYDDDGVRDTGEPYDDTDSLGRYSLVVTTTTAYRLREQRPTGGNGGWKCSYPNASTSGGFASGKGGDFGCGWGPITSDAVNGKDFGNYKQPKITVIKKLVPASDPGRFDLKVDSTVVKAAAGDGGSGSTLVSPGAHLVSETAAAGTDLADYKAEISCNTATAKTYGPGWVHPQSGDEVTCTITNTRLGKVEIAKVTDPHETSGTQFGFTGFAGAFNLPDGGVKTISRVAPSSTPYAVTESAASGYRLSSITCTDSDSTGAVGTRTASIKVARARPSAARSSTRSCTRASRSSSPARRSCTTATRWTSRSPCAASATRRCTTSRSATTSARRSRPTRSPRPAATRTRCSRTARCGPTPAP